MLSGGIGCFILLASELSSATPRFGQHRPEDEYQESGRKDSLHGARRGARLTAANRQHLLQFEKPRNQWEHKSLFCQPKSPLEPTDNGFDYPRYSFRILLDQATPLTAKAHPHPVVRVLRFRRDAGSARWCGRSRFSGPVTQLASNPLQKNDHLPLPTTIYP